MDDYLALVTEPCLPLETWIVQSMEARSADTQAKEETDVMLQEVMWGLKCVLLAMKFFHENCLLLHGNLSLSSVFVTPNGDWKLGGLELACNVTNAGDVDHFLKYAHLLDAVYCSPERLQRDALTAKSPPYYVDMYSFGQCVQRAFNAMDLELPRSYGKYLSSMLNADMKKRPTAQKLIESAMFSSEHLALVESIGELALKEPKEFLELVAKLEPKLQGLSRAVCAHKILPNLARTLQVAINDFPQRGADTSIWLCWWDTSLMFSLLFV
jgi:serine/threonine protein kinase